jgi:uncharacterized protein YqhQ
LEDEAEKAKKDAMSAEAREKQEKKEAKWLTFTMYGAVALSLCLGIGVFMLLPTVAVGALRDHVVYLNGALSTLLEGVVRIVIFIAYLAAVSRMKDIRRVFEYHGAEHKTIFCYEAGEALTVENVRGHSRLHPRCCTSFLLIVMVVSSLIFAFVPWPNYLARLLYRLALLPVVAGLSFEIIKLAGRSTGWFMKLVSAPGMALQRLTTREPDDAQIEVAVAALTGVLTGDRNDDKW